MKNAALYAKELRKFFNRIKKNGKKLSWPESDDPLEQLMIAVLSDGGSPTRSKNALNRLLAFVVDLNDLRVSTPQELAGIVQDDLPDALRCTTRLVRVLNAIYEKENAVTLDGVKSKGKRDTIQGTAQVL